MPIIVPGSRVCRASVVVWILFFFTSLWVSYPFPQAAADDGGLSFDLLRKRLVKEGFDEAGVKDLYGRSGVSFEIDGVSLFFMHSEARLNYGQFLSRKSIRNARQYMQAFHAELTGAEKEYGVDREIITAIISVETRLGSHLGNKSILNTLSTLAALSDPGLRQMFWARIPPSRRFTRGEFEEKAREKAEWAFSELRAFPPMPGRKALIPWGSKDPTRAP